MAKADRRDIFLLLGLAGLAAGIGLEYSPGWAMIVVGSILLTFGLAPWKGGGS